MSTRPIILFLFCAVTALFLEGCKWGAAVPSPTAGPKPHTGNVQSSPTSKLLRIFSNTAPGFFRSGAVIELTAAFDAVVTVTGTPKVVLQLDTASAYADYVSGSGTKDLIFRYIVVPGHNSENLSVSPNQAIVLAGGTIKAFGKELSVFINVSAELRDMVIDTTPPELLSVTSSSPDGTYSLGQSINVDINWSEPIVVAGTPQLKLETGVIDVVANYAQGSGTQKTTFGYQVAGGHTSPRLDYLATDSLTLNGATIADRAGNSAQSLSLPPPQSSGSLSGSSALVVRTTYELGRLWNAADKIAASGNVMVLAMNHQGLEFQNIANSAAPQLLGRFVDEAGSNFHVAIHGSLVFLVGRYPDGTRLKVLNIEVPGAPVVVKNFLLGSSWATDIAVNATAVCVSLRTEGGHTGRVAYLPLPLIANWESEQTRSFLDGAYISRLKTIGDNFVAYSPGARVVYLMTVDPTPNSGYYARRIASYDIAVPGTGPGYPATFEVSDVTLDAEKIYLTGQFAATGENAPPNDLRIVEAVGEPVNGGLTPTQLVSTIRVGDARGRIQKMRDTLYVEGWGNLFRINVASPANPVVTGRLLDIALLTDEGATERVIDFTLAAGNLLLAQVSGTGIVRRGDFVYLHRASRGLRMAESMAVSGNYAFVANSFVNLGDSFYEDNRVAVVDLSVPASPVVRANYTRNYRARIHGVYIEGSLAYLFKDGLEIVDISNPLNPVYRASFPGGFHDIVVRDGFAYLTSDQGIHVLNVSNPTSPVQTGFFNIGPCRKLKLAGDALAIVRNGIGLYFYRVVSPGNIDFASLQAVPEPDFSFAGAGSVAFFNRGNGVEGFDFSDPAFPQPRATFSSTPRPWLLSTGTRAFGFQTEGSNTGALTLFPLVVTPSGIIAAGPTLFHGMGVIRKILSLGAMTITLGTPNGLKILSGL